MTSSSMSESLIAAVLRSDHEGIRASISHGADVNFLGADGMSPLHWAVFRGDLDAVQLLLAAGGDPNQPSFEGSFATPFWHASEDFGLLEIASVLRASGGSLKVGIRK
jgi:ankyrin repeat protein